MVLFLGLGPFDRFTEDVQQLVFENAVRVLVRSRVDEFATVLIGAGSGQTAGAVLKNLLIGFLRGLKDADPNFRFRGITICEKNPARFADMREELVRLARTPLFEDIDLVLNETEVPHSEPAAAPVLRGGPEPVYTIIRQEEARAGRVNYTVSILGSGMKAAVVTGSRSINSKELDGQLQDFNGKLKQSSFSDVESVGRKFADLVLPPEVCTILESMKDRHLVIVHDTPTSRIPWEILTINDWTPALRAGLSRRYLADHLPIATWLEERRLQSELRLLLIVNPTGDL
jgi:hypothetical protein